ncbi:putative 2-aminoethylphosphonate ABC transporter ATP-binding protein [Paenibacillus chitinolyticus]
MNQAHLSIRGIRKTFGSFTALDSIHLDVRKNEFVCLLGPSGCGKTTLLRIIAGLEHPDMGTVSAGGKDITALPPAQRNFGMMFQSYALFPNMTAAQNIAFGLKSRKLGKRDIAEKVRESLDLVDLWEMRDKYPSQLSGGQQQRIALARAVALSPDFLLLDEPLSALDAKVRHKLRGEIRALQEKIGVTTIMVTHDQEEALTMADRIVVMNNAEVAQIGTPREVYERPASPFVADFIGAINFLDGAELQERGVRGAGGMMAVRPEHIGAEEPGSRGGIPAVVRGIEFRGPFYHVMLDVLGSGGEPLGRPMTIHVSAQHYQQLGLEKNKKLSLRLPEERLIAFEPQASAK